MKKHRSKIRKYDGSLLELATDIGDLRYDALADFLKHLSNKLREDGVADENRRRVKLSTTLYEASNFLGKAKIEIDESWKISKPFMNDYE